MSEFDPQNPNKTNTSIPDSNNTISNAVNSYQTDYLTPVTRIENIKGSKISKLIIITISLFIVFFVVWAYFTKIEEIVETKGEIIPMSKVYEIQHIEGGKIKDIYVKEGDEVMLNDKLIEFDPTVPKLELQQIRAKNASIISKGTELESYVTETKASQIQVGGKANKSTNIGVFEPSITSQDIYEQLNLPAPDKKTIVKKNKSSKPVVIKTDIGQELTTISEFKKQAEDDIAKFDTLLQILTKRLTILLQERDMYEKLFSTGVVSKKDYLELLRTITQTEEDINRAKAAYLETQYAIYKLQDRLNNIIVTAPIHGLVKGLQIHVGNVIQSGGFLMQIVPIEDLIAETRIPASDIGLVKVGDPVKVKVDTYDYTRYGIIKGTLTKISATTFLDEKANAYYKGEVQLEKSYVGDNPNTNRLLPGMTVVADINTGKRSLLIYLIRPIRVMFGKSFREPTTPAR